MSLRVTSEIKTPDYALIQELGYSQLIPVNSISPISPLTSPIKGTVENALTSEDIYKRETAFINAYCQKKHLEKTSAAPTALTALTVPPFYKEIIRSKINEPRKTVGAVGAVGTVGKGQTMKTRVILDEHFNCTICRRNNHHTDKCFYRCQRPACKYLEHSRDKCPYYKY